MFASSSQSKTKSTIRKKMYSFKSHTAALIWFKNRGSGEKLNSWVSLQWNSLNLKNLLPVYDLSLSLSLSFGWSTRRPIIRGCCPCWSWACWPPPAPFRPFSFRKRSASASRRRWKKARASARTSASGAAPAPVRKKRKPIEKRREQLNLIFLWVCCLVGTFGAGRFG